MALPVVASRDRDEGVVPGAGEEDPDADFSLSRSATQKIEELDLAPMVDVAFQLVLVLHGHRYHGTVQDARDPQAVGRVPRRRRRSGP